jgi:lipoate-protein ligase B
LEVRRLGLVPYREALALQEELVRRRQAEEIPDTLLLLEHPPVITLGRGASERYLLDGTGLEVVRTGRGGEITWHGPGQLVAYPIWMVTDLHVYLRHLEAAAIQVVAAYGLTAQRDPGRTGVWVGGEKLASIGIRVSRWITSHGLALNVGPDLEGFARIVPCGLEGVKMTSLARLLGYTPAQAEVEERFLQALEPGLPAAHPKAEKHGQ